MSIEREFRAGHSILLKPANTKRRLEQQHIEVVRMQDSLNPEADLSFTSPVKIPAHLVSWFTLRCKMKTVLSFQTSNLTINFRESPSVSLQ